MDATKNIAVVTGASGGFGKEFARLLCRKDDLDEIWAVARSADKLAALQAECGSKIKPVASDLSLRDSFDRIAALLQEEAVTVRYVINNAGFAKFCAYDDLSIDESRNMIDLNVNAVVTLGLLCIPYMTAKSRIINVASQASFQPLPYMNLYAATKAFVRNYTEALNVELKSAGITATAVCPGWMQTDLFARGDVPAKKKPTVFSHLSDPALVAQKALRDADKGKAISVYGAYVKFCHLAAKLLPHKTMMKLWLRQQKIK